MAGKLNSNKNKGKKGASRENETHSPRASEAQTVAVEGEGGVKNSDESAEVFSADKQLGEKAAREDEQKLYPVKVKGPAGEQIELQISPNDSVMDLRQFLLDSIESCFYTCYDLILHGPNGAKYQLAEFLEIGEVADITVGGFSLEMVNAAYDDRSVRVHVRRTRDLISTSNIYFSVSTALAMEFERKQEASACAEKTKNEKEKEVRQEITELEALGLMDEPSKMLKDLVSSPDVPDVKCIQSISFSSFNPVPGYRRLVGDLLYLDISTLEGKNYCVTAHCQGFFVNSSKSDVLNPHPLKAGHDGTTLVGLLHQLSPAFTKGFSEVLKRKGAGHPFENVPVLHPPNHWLGSYPPSPHKRDISRAEDALMSSYGSEVFGLQRDWNEELQSCRDFPRETPQDRLMRDRALYKVNCDFVDAAIKGAKAVIGRCIPPINPTDPDRFQMYVHNNIFFSFALDGDFLLMQQNREQEAQNTTDCEKQPDDKQPEEKQPEKEPKLAESIEPSLNAERDQSIGQKKNSTEVKDDPTNAMEGEQATYSSANNDLKGTKAYNNADVAGLYTLAMAIVDYRGHRVVAQSIIPGILQGDKSESLLYGSLDNGKKISWNEKFHTKVVEAGKLLHIKEHEVLDGSGGKVKLCAPVECKGIVGSDNRYYILDLMRTFPRDVNYTGPGSRLSVLRPELIAAFCQAESQTERDDKSIPTILFNPNVFTDFTVAGEPEEKAADEELVRKAGDYLTNVVLKKFIQDLSSLEVSPMDGQTLTEALHAHGINIRYLGKVAQLAKHMPHIYELCVVEMVVRSAKHVLKGILRETLDQDVGGCVAHFLNCLFGTVQSASPKVTPTKTSPGKKKKGGHSSPNAVVSDEANKQPFYACITSELVWIDIKESVHFKYQFDFADDFRAIIRKISAVRNICLKVGITLAARAYNLESATPFEQMDILDLQAVVKHAAPVCADAQELMENGKLLFAQGKVPEAYEHFSEAFFILQQVSGPMHREVANCCRYLAMVLYHTGDMGGAIMQQHKELIINERCLGCDHPDTAHSYGNMALFYHGLNQTDSALRHMARTLLLLNISCGCDHPDVAATFINIAVMYQELSNMHVALRYLQEALKKNERLLGSNHIQTAVCYHALAVAFNFMGAYKLSLQHEKSTHDILSKQLGEDDPRTKESANWMRTFQVRELQAHAQKQRGQAATMVASQKSEALKARADLVQVFQAAGGGAGRGINKAVAAAALLGETLPRTRGMDERGARAAAEVRKKAVAKGLNVRSSSSSSSVNPGDPTLSDLISLFNNGKGSSNSKNSTPSLAAAPAAPAASVPAATSTSDQASSNFDNRKSTPVGLGEGLSLETSKKKKNKLKQQQQQQQQQQQ
ncbi:clustered mitochondria protein [Selaginella moellendorffii]|uniref:clustered mitochondria protein n=1 Tax=Selaginella moellendorffii TaxID=88036 RepID=UPI000D1CD563|nr:clustered mitochondria protein [Selaginella moellendorffii]|eukprot:XP_024538093.1 clustered mitochondria protein [Selaginella moellendorffii]